MKKIFSVFLTLFLGFSLAYLSATPALAQSALSTTSNSTSSVTPQVIPSAEETGQLGTLIGSIDKMIVPTIIPAGETSPDWFVNETCATAENANHFVGGGCSKDPVTGNIDSPGLLGFQGQVVAFLFNNQISGQEYVADLLNNMGVPTVSHAYAAATGSNGYNYLSPFLPFWKVFRNLAYSLYIIMFIVVGIMIMLRTKVNAQTIITIQSALPNLLITLILITFSYAIVGFMIDIMYFLIYFAVYLLNSAQIISDPTKLITRLMSNSAAGVLFTGRWSIVEAIGASLGGLLNGLGTGALGIGGNILSRVSPMFLIVAVAFVIAMIKLMFALVKAYVMLIVQTVTAPIQILMNAMPGSKAFSDWLKKTASYLIPFPIAAIMFIFAAILVGNPTDRTWFSSLGDTNPFGVNQNADLYQNRQNIWFPPFTLTDATETNQDVLSMLGFFVFLMTPAAVKMAQDWLQVKESPYTAEAFSNAAIGSKAGSILPSWAWKSFQEEQAAQRSAKALGSVINAPKDLDKAQPKV